MGLFGGLGKVFGGALKIAGKVAGVASAVAPIPGLGFAGKVAGGLGGVLNKGKKIQSQVRLIQSSASGGQLKPGVVASLSPVMPGGAVLVSGVQKMSKAISTGTKKRRKRRKASSRRRRRSSRRRRGGFTPAQLRAGFGGKRRMRRR